MRTGLRLLAMAIAGTIIILVSVPAAGAHRLPQGWLRAALCVHSHEARNWHETRGIFEGGMQFLNSTWLANGGGRYARHAYDATPHQQLDIAYRLWQRASWNPWPTTARICGLLR